MPVGHVTSTVSQVDRKKVKFGTELLRHINDLCLKGLWQTTCLRNLNKRSVMKLREIIGSQKQRALSAFSMVEATIGLAILATVGGALMTGITNGYFTMQMTRENLRATQIILEKVETLRLCSWDQITGGFISNNVADYYDPNTTTNNRGISYSVTTVITNVPFSAGYGTNMRQVSFTVNWKTGQMPRSRTYTTFVARDGLQNYIY